MASFHSQNPIDNYSEPARNGCLEAYLHWEGQASSLLNVQSWVCHKNSALLLMGRLGSLSSQYKLAFIKIVDGC